MLLLIVLCLIGTTSALPVPQTEDVFIQEWVPVNTISLGDEADNLFDDILKAVQVATPIVTALAGKREIQVSDDLFADILAIVSQGPDPCGFAGCAYLLQQELAKAQAGDEADNLFDDILKAVQVATPIVTTLAGKRYNSFLDIDPILPVLPTPIISPLITGRDVQEDFWDDLLEALMQPMGPAVALVGGKRETEDILFAPTLGPITVSISEEQENLFGDILKVVETVAPLAIAILKRDLSEEQENLWDDIMSIAQTITPLLNTVVGKREEISEQLLHDILASIEPVYCITVSGCILGQVRKRELSEEQENLFGDILKVVETVAPLAIAVLGKRETEDALWLDFLPQPLIIGDEADNIFDDILKAVQVVTPIVTALAGKRDAQEDFWSDLWETLTTPMIHTIIALPIASGKREVINLDLLKPIIEPFIYPAIDKRGLQTQDTFIDDILATPVVSNPTLISILGKRQVGDESDNLFDDILSAVQVATPIITAFAGKRELTEEQQTLFDDILSAVQVATPIITAFAGKRQFDEADNLFDDILKAVQVATPIVTALAGKREVADSEWFDTFLAAVEAATPTILGVIQGAGTA